MAALALFPEGISSSTIARVGSIVGLVTVVVISVVDRSRWAALARLAGEDVPPAPAVVPTVAVRLGRLGAAS
ncbi:hypothetical protein [Actinophytocola sediminis]